MAEAWLYDGLSAVRHGVAVHAAPEGLRLIYASGAETFVAAEDLVHVESRTGEEVLGHGQIGGWRLQIPTPVDPELKALLPKRRDYGSWIDRVGIVPAVLAGALLSAAIVLAGTQLPTLLAPLVPRSLERHYGELLLGDLGGRVCDRAEGKAALDKLVAGLAPRQGELKVRVTDVGMVNAVALPGGNIILFKELLTEAESPDAVAGVLAHEIAHDENRDVTRTLIRELGFGLLLSTFGGNTGLSVDALLSAGYSREAESRADGDAILALRRAGISPVPTARFFEKLAVLESKLGKVGPALNYISTHPMSQDRRRRFLDAREAGRAYRPSLTRDEWEALQDIC